MSWKTCQNCNRTYNDCQNRKNTLTERECQCNRTCIKRGENAAYTEDDGVIRIWQEIIERLQTSVLKVYIKKKFHGEMDILMILTVLHLKTSRE